jgi:chromosomal replication initiator protein
MLDTKQLWDSVLAEMELTLSKATFTTWFKDTFILKCEDGIVYLSVPNQFAKEWLFNKYHKTILKSLRNISDSIRNIEYSVTKEMPKKMEETRRLVEQTAPELPLSDYYNISKEDNLNPRYTFDGFVVGPFNELAHAAAQAVVKKPGITYNPLFIYGDTGHGKTHLIQAVGNFFKHNGGRKVYYITSEKFTMDCVNAIQENKMNNFKEKYRAYDVFIMDDIQFLSKKEKTQEELFHLFNTLHDNNKQIVFSSDKHPQYIQNLEDRLKSRFSAGMIIDIPAPDHESRVAILKNKLTSTGLLLADEVVDFIADNAGSNIRELEGALNAAVLQTQLKGKELSLGEIKQLIKDNARPKKAVSVKDVIRSIAEFYDIDENSIYEKTRRKEVVKPRQLIMYILREDFKVSYPTIGEKLGGRDHTTVIHSCEKIKNDLKEDPTLTQEVQQIRSLLR